MDNQPSNQLPDSSLSLHTSPQETQEANTLPDKTKLCDLYNKGFCHLTPRECKFAHGAKDLKYTKVDISSIPKPLTNERLPGGPKTNKPDPEKPREDEEEETDPDKPRIIENHTHVYQFQEDCYAKGLITERFTLEQLNTNLNCLREIRRMFRANIAQEFFDLLCSVYETFYFPKYFVKYSFENIGWEAHFAYLYRRNYATEKKVKDEDYIIRLPPAKEFDAIVRTNIVSIIKSRKLVDSLPINPSIIKIAYFKDFMAKDPFTPDIVTFLKINNYKKLDQYLQVLEKDPEFLVQLCNECGKSLEEIGNQSIFDEESPAYLEFKKKAEEILLDMVKKSSFGFVMYSEYKAKILQTFNKQMKEFGKSETQVERLLYEFAFKNKILILNLLSDTYMFSTKKIQDSKLVNLRKEVPKAFHQICFESTEIINSGHSHCSLFHKIDPDSTDSYGKIDEKFLEKEIDLSKVLVVESFETFEIAKEFLKNVTSVGIDLEGILSKGGNIELLQFGCPDKIVVFDLYGINSKAAKSENPESEKIALSKVLKSFIKSFLEDPKICKVFHDCRKDSLALHSLANSCPTNVIDLSALYMLIEQLKIYQKFAVAVGLAKSNPSHEEAKSESDSMATLNDKTIAVILEEIGRFWPPGLNDVLNKYEATHGPNGLKTIFKERFDKINDDYFYKRPVDKEFLIYSARDVEDLVEVKEKMVRIISELLSSLGFTLEEEKVLYVCMAASKTYSIYGCDHRN